MKWENNLEEESRGEEDTKMARSLKNSSQTDLPSLWEGPLLER